jgi:hypothetical protein
MTSFALRSLALLTMIMDHLGYSVFSQLPWLRTVGRLSFPIYCFLVAQGFRHTHSVKQYAIRLALFAAISEIPYNMVFHRGATLMLAAHNVFFSLLLALGVLAAWKRFVPNDPFWAWLSVCAACALALLLETDYTYWGILLTLSFYLAGEDRLRQALGLAATLAFYSLIRLATRVSPSWVLTQAYCLLALIPIWLYNGKPGFRRGKWVFYILYPLHLALLTSYGRSAIDFLFSALREGFGL